MLNSYSVFNSYIGITILAKALDLASLYFITHNTSKNITSTNSNTNTTVSVFTDFNKSWTFFFFCFFFVLVTSTTLTTSSIFSFSSLVILDFNFALVTSTIILNLLLISKLISISPLNLVSLLTTCLNDKFFLFL